MSRLIRILLADDQVVVRQGLRLLIERAPGLEVVGEAANGTEAVQMAERLHPDVAVLDLAMPSMDGIEATRRIRTRCPGVTVLLLSMFGARVSVRDALAAGARGYLLKSDPDLDLPTAIGAALAGRTILSKGLTLPGSVDPVVDARLSAREREVLPLIVAGRSNREIAVLLGLSVNTVSVHRANLMQALGVHCTAELVVRAIRCGLVDVSGPE
jgi:DNA-binding NarL/FixJ family response regulator